MKKLFILLTVLSSFWISSCDSPTQKTDLIDTDTIIDNWYDHPQCPRRGNGFDNNVSIEISSLNADKTIVLFGRQFGTESFLNLKTKEITSLKNRFWDSKRNDWVILGGIMLFPSCPYDNKKFIGTMYTGDPNLSNEEVKDYAFWGIFEPESGKVEEISLSKDGKDFTVRNVPQGFEDVRILRWLKSSTPGNDYFFLSDNTILHRQSGTTTVGIPGLNLDSSIQIESVSPDGKIALYQKNGILYLNNTNVNELDIRRQFPQIDWSDDSKSIIFTSYVGRNSVIYKYKVSESGEVTLETIIDLTLRFCSYGPQFSARFLSDSTIGTNVFKYNQIKGNLFEIKFNGKLVRELTNFTD